MAKGTRTCVEMCRKEKVTVDSVYQADKAWLLDIQGKLYRWSRVEPDSAYRDMWNWVTDPRNLRMAWRRIPREGRPRKRRSTMRRRRSV